MKPKKRARPGPRRQGTLKPRIDALGFASWLYSGEGKRVTLFQVLIMLEGTRGKLLRRTETTGEEC